MQPRSDSTVPRVLQTAEQDDAAIASLTLENTAAGSAEERLELYMRRNATIPAISRVPDEILAEVFALVAQDCRHRRVSGWRPLGWIIVTHICRHWRIIALNHASLWARQIRLLSNPDCWQTFLRRSKKAPLFISAPAFDLSHDFWIDHEPLDRAMFETIQTRAPYFQSLSLDVSAKLLCSLAHESPTLDAPILKSLYIRFWRGAQIDTHDDLWFLSNSPLPSLTDLRLMRAPSPLLFMFFRATLTRLIVLESCVTVEEWIECLALMPSLEFLQFSDSVQLESVILSPPSTPVLLPHLRHLVLNGEYGDEDSGIAFAHLLKWIDVRADCSVVLTEADTHQYHELFSALTTKFTPSAHRTHMARPIKACTVTLGPVSFAFAFWKSLEAVVRLKSSKSYGSCGEAASGHWHDYLEDEDSPHFALSMECTSDDPIEDIVDASLPLLPCSDPTFLYLLVDDTYWLSPPDSPCVRKVLPAFAHITHLHFTPAGTPTSFLHHLAQPGAPSNALSDALGMYPILPNLQVLTLHLEHTDIQHAHPGRQRSSHVLALREDVEAMLAAREEMGLPLVSLCLGTVREEEIPVLAEMAAMREEITWTITKDPHWHL